MRVRWIEVPVFLLLLVAPACGQVDRSAASLATLREQPPAQGTAPALTLASQREILEQARRIRTARLRLEVQDLAPSEKEVSAEVERLGGFIQDSRASGEGTDRTTAYVLRVPAERFDDAVEGLQELGRVLESSTQTEDVTEAYADLEMRIRVKTGVEARLRAILEDRTGKLSDVLEVENQLARVVEEAERLETALHGYDRQITWSTVKLDLRQAQPIVQTGFLAKVSGAFREGVATFTTAASAVVYLLTFLAPWLLTGSILLWAVLRSRRRRDESVA